MEEFDIVTGLTKCADIWQSSDATGEVIPPCGWFALTVDELTQKLIEADHDMLDTFEPKLKSLHIDLMRRNFSLQEEFFIRHRSFFTTCHLEDMFLNRANHDVEWVAKTHTEEHLIYWLLTVPWWCFCDHQLRLTAEDLLDRYRNVTLTNEGWWRNPEPPYWD